MTTTVTRPARQRPSTTARRAGYVIAAVINGALLYLVHVEPGWRAVPFLTEDTTRVLPLVTASLVVGIAVNLLYLAWDGRRLHALGDLVTSAIALGVLVRLWQVFPFDFGDPAGGADWALVVRVVLIVTIVGTAIAVVAQVATLLRPGPAVRS